MTYRGQFTAYFDFRWSKSLSNLSKSSPPEITLYLSVSSASLTVFMPNAWSLFNLSSFFLSI